jgi:hypothetical protein
MRPALLALALVALSACSSSGPPRSRYFVVPFEAGHAEIGGQAKAVLDEALREAKSGSPRLVAVKGYVGADGAERELAERRMQAVEQALVGGGVPGQLVRIVPQAATAETVSRLGNGVVVQIERGKGPLSPPGG